MAACYSQVSAVRPQLKSLWLVIREDTDWVPVIGSRPISGVPVQNVPWGAANSSFSNYAYPSTSFTQALGAPRTPRLVGSRRFIPKPGGEHPRDGGK